MLFLPFPNVRNSYSEKLAKSHKTFCGKNFNLNISEQNHKQIFSKQDMGCLPRLILYYGFPGGSDSKEPACSAGDLHPIPVLGRSPGGGNGNPLHYSYLENPHGQRSLAGYSPWGCKELDTTEWLSPSFINFTLFFKINKIKTFFSGKK